MRRKNRLSKPTPLPQPQGIGAVSVLLPDATEGNTLGTETVLDYLVARFPPMARPLFEERFARGEVREADGRPAAPGDPLVGQRVWYYRELGQEWPVPSDMPVLYEDEWVLAVDKPHFLPTTPNGSFVAHTALVKLRVREENPQLSPVHRLDRATAGVVLFAKVPEARAPFQTMFEKRRATKTYEAVAAPVKNREGRYLLPGQSLTVRSRIDNTHGRLQVAQSSVELAPGDCPPLPPETGAQKRARHRQGLTFSGLNAQSKISCLRTYRLGETEVWGGDLPRVSRINPALPLPQAGSDLALYRLEPHTGKTHQLRVHLAAAGAPIAGDVLYPQVLPLAQDEPALPLQLLARTLAFTHPITGEAVSIQSRRQLALAPR